MSESPRFESLLLTLLNPLAFALRNRIRHRRKGYRESRQDAPLDERARATLTRHSLLPLVESCNEYSLASSLHVVDLLEQVFARAAPLRKDALRVLDVGAKNFDYAPGLSAALVPFAASRSRIHLTGVELDAFRVYSSLYSRADAAHYFLDLTRTCGFRGAHRYVAGDVRDHCDRYDVITWFSPFLSEYPLLRWGLARKHLRPAELLSHVRTLLDDGALLVVVNQEPEEADSQRSLFRELGIAAESFTVESRFPRKYVECYVHIVRA